ncbi:hypothetical protein HDV02_002137 [Globomyces sp. JEL0801]|nr:hypothetical protein HDV02_002137 [Globomyces sp. JEL0801]
MFNLDRVRLKGFDYVDRYQLQIIKYLGSMQVANMVAFAIGILQLVLILYNIGLVMTWYLNQLRALAMGLVTMWAVMSVISGVFMVASLMACILWPICVFQTTIMLGLQDCQHWVHMPPYYSEISLLQSYLTHTFIEWIDKKHRDVVHRSLIPLLPPELVLQVNERLDRMKIESIQSDLLNNSLLKSPMDPSGFLFGIMGISEVMVVVHKNDDNPVWLLVVSKDLFMMTAFMVTVGSISSVIWTDVL